MPPRSLLFCSHRETSQLLTSFLRGLHFEVEHCPEIFDAVRRLTSHSHEVIVIDWDEGVEAAFLLKTARELRSNRDAFVIAVAKADALLAVREAGANEVVIKPPVSEIKKGLVSGKDFLAGLERRLEVPQVRAKSPVLVRALPGSPIRARLDLAVEPLTAPPARNGAATRDSASSTITFASFDNGLFDTWSLRRVIPYGRRHFVSVLKNVGRRNTLLRLAAMVVAFFTVGYVASQPLSQVGASMAEMYQGVWGIAPPNHHAARATPTETADLAQASLPEPMETQRHSSLGVQVTPLYNDPLPRERATGEPARLVESSVTSDERQQRPRTAGLRIPDSLERPFPGAATLRNVAEKLSPAILGALEPVDLPGYLSEKLVVDKVEPSYPERALKAGLRGPVVLRAWIGRDGKVRDLKLIRGPLLLGEAAYEAVKQWRYRPYLMNGEAVEAQTYVTIDFKLP